MPPHHLCPPAQPRGADFVDGRRKKGYNTGKPRKEESRTKAYEDEFVRALCRCAADELQKAQTKI